MITQEEIAEKESSFYAKPFTFSYSSINRLLYAPSLFYQEYILKQRPIKVEKHLVEGHLIHFLLLPDQNFNDKFVIVPEGIPTGYGKIVVEKIYESYCQDVEEVPSLENYKDEIISLLKELNYYQNLVDDKKEPFLTGDEKRLNKILTSQNENYFKYLFDAKRKEIVDYEVLERCQKIVETLKSDSCIRDLLGFNYNVDFKTIGLYNELKLEMPLEGEEMLKLGGVLDNVIVLVKEKKIRITDVKTTSKSLVDFEDSLQFYNYWLQAAIYVRLVKHWLNFVDESWTIEFRFLVIDKYNQYYPFLVSKQTMEKWNNQLKEELKKVKYHYHHKQYKLPYNFATGIVTL